MNTPSKHIPAHYLREFTPFIRELKSTLAVVLIPGELSSNNGYNGVVRDLALLQGMGLQMVLVFGSRPQIDSALQKNSQYQGNVRITTKEDIDTIVKVCASERLRHQRAFGVASANNAFGSSGVSTVWGNWISAKPIGVQNGVDLQYSGKVRRIHTQAIRNLLNNGHVAMVDVIALSPFGKAYNLVAEDLALELAIELGAEKLVVYCDIHHLHMQLPIHLTIRNAEELITLSGDPAITALHTAISARKGGVKRIHLIDMAMEGSIIEELLTVNGGGVMLSDDDYQHIDVAKEQDIPAILELIRPLIQRGQLRPRDKKLLENHLSQYRILYLDGQVAGCYALSPLHENSTLESSQQTMHSATTYEFSCFAVGEAFQRANLGVTLLRDALAQYPNTNMVTFTTQTVDWFLEHGFMIVDENAIPKNFPTSLSKRIHSNATTRKAQCLLHSASPLAKLLGT